MNDVNEVKKADEVNDIYDDEEQTEEGSVEINDDRSVKYEYDDKYNEY